MTGRPWEGPGNGCRYHPDCFSCPFADCVLADAKAPQIERGPGASEDPPHLPEYRQWFGDQEGVRLYKRDHERWRSAAKLEKELRAADLWTKENAANVWAKYVSGRANKSTPS